MNERNLLSKFESLGLFRNMGEDGILGICSLRNVDIKSLKEIMSALTRKKLGYSVQDKSEEKVSSSSDNKSAPSQIGEDENYVCGNLKVNISAATLQYKNNIEVDIQPSNREIKFLVTLIKNGKVVKYSEVASAIDSTTFGEEEIARAVQYLKRDLKPVLVKAGMTNQEINKMIVPVRNIGYKIVPPQE